ncbi:MAG: o-succinylbenzoate synthase, partial [Candidatus Acidiferrales bacterium]
MRLNRVTLREIHMPLIAPFQTSFGISTLRRIVLIEAEVDGVIGWGEATVGEDPYYCYETVETGWHILRDHAWPLMKGKDFGSAREVTTILSQIR